MNGYWSRIHGRRISRRRWLAASGGTAVGAALLAACGGDGDDGGGATGLLSQPKDTSKQAKRGAIVHDVAFAETDTFDALTNPGSRAVGQLLVDFLVRIAPGHLKRSEGTIIPAMAESWEFSPDKLTISLKLRQGIKWENRPPTNGRLFDAEDVLAMWERQKAEGRRRLEAVNALNPNAPIVSITSPDAKTVAVKLAHPLSYSLALLANNRMLPIQPKESGITSRSALDLRQDFISSGPFVLSAYEPGVRYTLKRNPNGFYEKPWPLVDEVNLPIVPEYATRLSQLQAGNIYTMGGPLAPTDVRQTDILPVKQGVPGLNIYASDDWDIFSWFRVRFGWTQNNPWRDERVRQAYSMSWDREAWLDASFNADVFESQGLPMETRWHSSMLARWDGYWLDPKSKDFGPEAKYYEHNLTEAKKLMAAAGYPDGFDYTSTFPSGTRYGADYQKRLTILEEFAREVGFRAKQNPVDFNLVWTPQYSSAPGKYEGVAYPGVSGGLTDDAVAQAVAEYHSQGGEKFIGFDAASKGDGSGDPQVDAILNQAQSELEVERAQSLIKDLQRYLAKKQYSATWPGTAAPFILAWPVLGNYGVNKGGNLPQWAYWWIDDSKPPLSK